MSDEQKKKNYEKPVLRTIELATDEVLAVGCKTAATPAVAQATCLLVPCSVAGS